MSDLILTTAIFYHIPDIKEKKKLCADCDPDDVCIHIDEYNDKNDDEGGGQNEAKNLDCKLSYKMRSLESIQYQAALAATGAWMGTSTQKLYEELGWESLHYRRWFRRATQLFKILNGLTPQYLLDPIPMPRPHLFGRYPTNDLYEFSWRNHRFLRSFYPDSVLIWNNLGPEIRKIETLSEFKQKLLKIIRPEQKSTFNVHDPEHLKYIYQLRVGLSPLHSHKHRHNFKDTPTDACRCGTGIETSEHFLLTCPLFTSPRNEMLATVNPVLLCKIRNVPQLENQAMAKILLYGSENLNPNDNKLILEAVIKYIQHTERFKQV